MTSPPAGVPQAETLVQVRSPELDSFGHVNHATFLHYLEHARYEALEAAGFPWPTLAARDWQIFVVRIEVDYLAEASVGDRLRITTWAQGFRRVTMDLAQRIERVDGSGAPAVVVARALVRAVWMGPDRRPMRVPQEVRAGLMNGRSP